ncbi:hypothetical protein AVEN_143252-1 [Araneus ventricosus]|uniref:Uncharacterized protein n=1 Tax=Araneus ventricosus TaxID=182803 RepID=A0A4Y2ADS0_ARAVE|nr:hypothetical protein AVEN_143252-1 [Araneus ventricosus]
MLPEQTCTASPNVCEFALELSIVPVSVRFAMWSQRDMEWTWWTYPMAITTIRNIYPGFFHLYDLRAMMYDVALTLQPTSLQESPLSAKSRTFLKGFETPM